MASGIEKYSLLKLKPALLSILKNSNNSPKIISTLSSMRRSLYGILDEEAGDNLIGRIVIKIDGELRTEFVVEKYERYKAGLMGRVWLRGVESEKAESFGSSSTGSNDTNTLHLGVTVENSDIKMDNFNKVKVKNQTTATLISDQEAFGLKWQSKSTI